MINVCADFPFACTTLDAQTRSAVTKCEGRLGHYFGSCYFTRTSADDDHFFLDSNASMSDTIARVLKYKEDAWTDPQTKTVMVRASSARI